MRDSNLGEAEQAQRAKSYDVIHQRANLVCHIREEFVVRVVSVGRILLQPLGQIRYVFELFNIQWIGKLF